MRNRSDLLTHRIGTTIRDKYRIDAVLGMGGMAVVYAATHRNQAEFAIKMLHPELSLSTDLKTRFLREGYAANSVKHPGVVLIVDDDIAEDGSAFLVMERLRGTGVDALADRGVTMSEAMAIVDQLLDVLGAAHEKKIIHRDIKPANLFLTHDGTVKVLDFGIARARDGLVSAGGATATGALMGTPAFMAPEQALAKTPEIDGRTDLWAAGATLFTLIAGVFVHEGENAPQLLVNAATVRARSLSSVTPTAPAAVVEFLAHALAFDKADRFPTAAAMQDALREAHRIAFGRAPSRESLAALLHGEPVAAKHPPAAISGTQATEVAAATPMLNVHAHEAAGGASQITSTTHHAVASAPTLATKRRAITTLSVVAAAVVLLTGAAFAISRVGGSGGAGGSAGPEHTPSVALSASAVPSPSVTTALTATHSAAPSASVSAAPSSKPAPSTKPKPAASAKRSCDPNYYYENGVKHFKEECLP